MALPNLADILAKISDGLCVLDQDGHITFANDKASQILQQAGTAFQARIRQALRDAIVTRFESFNPTTRDVAQVTTA